MVGDQGPLGSPESQLHYTLLLLKPTRNRALLCTHISTIRQVTLSKLTLSPAICSPVHVNQDAQCVKMSVNFSFSEFDSDTSIIFPEKSPYTVVPCRSY